MITPPLHILSIMSVVLFLTYNSVCAILTLVSKEVLMEVKKWAKLQESLLKSIEDYPGIFEARAEYVYENETRD